MNQPAGLLVFDGPSATGKSYLAKYFQQKYGAKYFHCTYRFKNRMYTYHLAQLRRALKAAETGLAILDRSWASEDIYAAVFRNGSKWPQEGRLFQKILLKHAALQVFFIAPPEKVQQAIDMHRRENYHSPQFIADNGKTRKIAELYWQLYYGNDKVDAKLGYAKDVILEGGFQHVPLSYKYDMSEEGKDVASYANQLLRYLELGREFQYKPALSNLNHNICGYLPSAKIVLVGDQVNHPDYRRVWPFSGYQGSSLFLAKSMSQIGCLEEEFMWTNVHCPEQHLLALQEADEELKYVALGQEASKHLKDLDIPHQTVRHPAYAMRWTQKSNYAEDLRVAFIASGAGVDFTLT